MQFLLKMLLSAAVIAGASEAAKRSPALGGIIASLPLTSLLALIWLYAETRDTAAAAAFSSSVFWAVLASLPAFLVLSWLLRRGLGFVPALAIACVTAFAGYRVYLSQAK